jgi:hypothetical protein
MSECLVNVIFTMQLHKGGYSVALPLVIVSRECVFDFLLTTMSNHAMTRRSLSGIFRWKMVVINGK